MYRRNRPIGQLNLHHHRPHRWLLANVAATTISTIHSLHRPGKRPIHVGHLADGPAGHEGLNPADATVAFIPTSQGQLVVQAEKNSKRGVFGFLPAGMVRQFQPQKPKEVNEASDGAIAFCCAQAARGSEYAEAVNYSYPQHPVKNDHVSFRIQMANSREARMKYVNPSDDELDLVAMYSERELRCGQ